MRALYAVILGCAFAMADVAAEPELRLNDAAAKPGQTFTLRVQLAPNGETLAGVQGQLALPAGVQLVDALPGEALGGEPVVDIEANDEGAGLDLAIVIYDLEQPFADGHLLLFDMAVEEEAQPGEFSLDFGDSAILASFDGEHAIAPFTPAANFEILPEALFGDVNRDGQVDAADIQIVINAILGVPLPHGVHPDVTGTGSVNAIDLQSVINAVLGISSETIPGEGKDSLDAPDILAPPVFPAAWAEDGERRQATPDSVIAVRLSADAPIDPDSVWAVAELEDEVVESTEWRAVTERDGWVALTPGGTWPEGIEFLVEAGGVTMDGEPVTAEEHRFVARSAAEGSSEAAEQPSPGDLDAAGFDSSDSAARIAAFDGPPLLSEEYQPIGAAYRIGPDQVFDEPRRAWLPLPEGAGAATLFYHHAAKPDLGLWYPAGRVAGWLEAEKTVEAEFGGQRYLGVSLRHGGVVQLAAPVE